MSEDASSPSAVAVNQHYLDKVMDLSGTMNIEASEDIVDARGMKLVAKGTRLSPALQERLILHKLRTPLETCITVDGGIDIGAMAIEAERMLAADNPVGLILATVKDKGKSPLQVFSGVKLGNSMRMMLTMMRQDGGTACSHAIMVSLVSICLAKSMGLGDADQSSLALAGLLHDIGELYIAPDYLSSKKRLLPHEWRHVVVHPRIGQMLIRELDEYPVGVANTVFEHHERFNGTGYPRQLTGRDFSVSGQILSVAEMVSGVLMKQYKPLERAELALKIIPGEHAPDQVSAISRAMRNRNGTAANAADDDPPEEALKWARGLQSHIAGLIESGKALYDGAEIVSKGGKDLLVQALGRIQAIQRAFVSTGIDSSLLSELSLEPELEYVFEVTVATKELLWRLRDVARDLSLHSARLEPQETAAFQGFIALLDEEPHPLAQHPL